MNTLIRYEPFRGLRQELDRLFDTFTPDSSEDTPSVWMPRFDLSETDDAFVMRMDLPGLKPEDVEVTIQDDQLVVRGERSHRASEARENFHRVERSYGSFFRALSLPRNADRDHIEANVEDGVLTVAMPKTAESQPRHIEVGATRQLASTMNN
ncbi:MAG: Hsp20/alpha crystallin family protein [Rhodothermaceae bacterium]|nr:Hsp20/alpha crystallin family protein [Rhodothermaceae bacterium]